jgi:hypothetical protein
MNAKLKKLKITKGNEPGANEQWIPGGFTNATNPEAVIDQIRIDEYIVLNIE